MKRRSFLGFLLGAPIAAPLAAKALASAPATEAFTVASDKFVIGGQEQRAVFLNGRSFISMNGSDLGNFVGYEPVTGKPQFRYASWDDPSRVSLEMPSEPDLPGQITAMRIRDGFAPHDRTIHL